jgi:nitrilase
MGSIHQYVKLTYQNTIPDKDEQRLAKRGHLMASESSYLAACVQAAPVAFDVALSVQKVADLTADAARQGVRVVLFPEAFISAYPRGASFGAVVGARSTEGREQFALYHTSSIDVPGPVVSQLAEIARRNSVHLVIGVIEREGGTLYCSVLFFGADGSWLGKHRKLMPTGAERLIWGFGDGSTMAVFNTELGRLGAVICWENYMPMMRAAMYAQHIQLYCAPTADGRPTWLPSMQHIALEGRCFVLSTNQFCRRSNYPAVYRSDLPADPNAIVSRGGACIVDPLGTVLAGPLWDQEGIIVAPIDMRITTQGLYDFDPVGHYGRPDIFRLSVDTSVKRAVDFGSFGIGSTASASGLGQGGASDCSSRHIA